MKRMTQEHAEAVAVLALQHIAEDVTLLGRFLALSGCGPGDIRNRASSPEFLGAVLDFVLGDESLIHDVAERYGISPTVPLAARLALPGAPVEE